MLPPTTGLESAGGKETRLPGILIPGSTHICTTLLEAGQKGRGITTELNLPLQEQISDIHTSPGATLLLSLSHFLFHLISFKTVFPIGSGDRTELQTHLLICQSAQR